MTGSPRVALGWAAGFTLVELVGIIAILGILLAVAAPRFFNPDTFAARGYEDGARAFLRYAQKLAVARHGEVHVHVGGGGLTLCAGPTPPCSGAQRLPGPDGQVPFELRLPARVSQSPTQAVLGFDARGRPSAALTLTISGEVVRVVRVEAETGYVH